MLEFRLLGPVEALVGGSALSLGGARQRGVRETTDRDRLEPVNGAGALNAVANRSGNTRRGALHGHIVAVGQLHDIEGNQGLIISTRTGPVAILRRDTSPAPAVPRMRASPAVPGRRSLGTTSEPLRSGARDACFDEDEEPSGRASERSFARQATVLARRVLPTRLVAASFCRAHRLSVRGFVYEARCYVGRSGSLGTLSVREASEPLEGVALPFAAAVPQVSSGCCTPPEQESCCEAEAKPSCCGTASTERCGCR
jgi:hypothetical protein